jgi:putative addiction module component (TIGR02574 family)
VNDLDTPTVDSVFEDALKLSDDDRELLVIRLAGVAGIDFANLDTDEWQAELASRIAQVRSGNADVLDWDATRQEIRRALP